MGSGPEPPTQPPRPRRCPVERELWWLRSGSGFPCITLPQPYAEAVVRGHADAIGTRYRGSPRLQLPAVVAIHAASRPASLEGRTPAHELWPGPPPPTPSLPRRAIVGAVLLQRVEHRQVVAETSWIAGSALAWILGQSWALPQPVPTRGRGGDGVWLLPHDHAAVAPLIALVSGGGPP